MLATKHLDWDDGVELTMFNFNPGKHEGTQHTPYELVFDQLARVSSSDPLELEDLLPTYAGYMTALVEMLSFLQETAQKKLLLDKQRAKEYYDKKSNHNFKIGNFVCFESGTKSHKFENQYSGPYLVFEIWENGKIKLQIKENKTKVVHSNRLRLSHVKPPASSESTEE